MAQCVLSEACTLADHFMVTRILTLALRSVMSLARAAGRAALLLLLVQAADRPSLGHLQVTAVPFSTYPWHLFPKIERSAGK